MYGMMLSAKIAIRWMYRRRRTCRTCRGCRRPGDSEIVPGGRDRSGQRDVGAKPVDQQRADGVNQMRFLSFVGLGERAEIRIGCQLFRCRDHVQLASVAHRVRRRSVIGSLRAPEAGLSALRRPLRRCPPSACALPSFGLPPPWPLPARRACACRAARRLLPWPAPSTFTDRRPSHRGDADFDAVTPEARPWPRTRRRPRASRRP